MGVHTCVCVRVRACMCVPEMVVEKAGVTPPVHPLYVCKTPWRLCAMFRESLLIRRVLPPPQAKEWSAGEPRGFLPLLLWLWVGRARRPCAPKANLCILSQYFNGPHLQTLPLCAVSQGESTGRREEVDGPNTLLPSGHGELQRQ